MTTPNGQLEAQERLEPYDHLGSDFLTWLIFELIERDWVSTHPKLESHPLCGSAYEAEWAPGRSVTLIRQDVSGGRVRVDAMDYSEANELYEAVRQGACVSEAHFSFVIGELLFEFGLQGHPFSLTNVRVANRSGERFDFKNDPIEFQLESCDLQLSTLEHVIHDLYRDFLKVRLDREKVKGLGRRVSAHVDASLQH